MSKEQANRTWAVVTCLVWVILTTALSMRLWPGIDFQVYRDAAVHLQSGIGGPLYDQLFSEGLPFTYPPFSVLLFAPLAWLNEATMLWVFRASSLLALLIIWLVLWRAIPRLHNVSHVWFWVSITLAALSSPIRETIDKGQINLLLMLICLVALVHLRRFWSGFLIGIAGGIKLTPLALGLVFLKQRDWRAVVGVAAGFGTSVGAGWLALSAESRQFWFTSAVDAGRVGNVTYVGNSSLLAIVQRVLAQGDHVGSAIWFALVALTTISAFLLIPGQLDTLSRVKAAGIAACVMLLISPITWTHHWVWFPVVAVSAVATVESCRGLAQWMVGSLWLLGGSMLALGPLELSHSLGFSGNEHHQLMVILGSWIPVTTVSALVVAALGQLSANHAPTRRSPATDHQQPADAITPTPRHGTRQGRPHSPMRRSTVDRA